MKPFRRYSSSQYLLQNCWRVVKKTNFPWVIHLQGVLKTSWRRLEDVLTILVCHHWYTSWRHLKDVLKMSWVSIDDVFKILRLVEDVLNTRTKVNIPRWVYTKDVFTKTNVCWATLLMSLWAISIAWPRFLTTSPCVAGDNLTQPYSYQRQAYLL